MSVMNMPPPMSLPAYNNINDILHECYQEVALKSTSNAAQVTSKHLLTDNQLSLET